MTGEEGGFNYRMKKMAKIVREFGKDKTILDIGFSLSQNPYLGGNLIGVDIIKPQKLMKNYNRFVKANVCEKMPFADKSIDIVVFSGIIEHIENPLKALREINRVLKDGGILLIETPNPYFLPVIISDLLMWTRFYFRDTHIALYPRRIILKMLWHTGFNLKKIKSCGINLNEERLTIPCPQQFAQDVIYITRKEKIKHKRYNMIRNLRVEGYE